MEMFAIKAGRVLRWEKGRSPHRFRERTQKGEMSGVFYGFVLYLLRI